MGSNHFIIVGGMRCGSSYLAGLLDSHPQVQMAKPFIGSEPKFFCSFAGEALTYSDYYSRYFSNSRPNQVLGEKSVSYLEDVGAPIRIKSIIEDPKIVIILRNPVYRAISHYYYSRKNGLEFRDLTQAFHALQDMDAGPEFDHISMPPFNYLSRGIYLPNLQRYRRVFGDDNIHIIVLENLSATDSSCLTDLFTYLNVDSNFRPPNYGKKTNQSTPLNQSIPESLIQKLEHYFSPHNLQLTTNFSLDLKLWGI